MPEALRGWFAKLASLNQVEFAQVLEGWSAAATALIAIAAGFIALYQIRVARRLQGETTAKELYRDYLKLCLDLPAFATPPDDPKTAFGPMGYERYEWFVAILLWAAEEISSVGRLRKWRATLKAQIGNHCDYLASDDFTAQRHHYTPAVQSLIRKALKAEAARLSNMSSTPR